MKNKKVIIIIAVVFVIALGLGIFGYIKYKEDKPVKEPEKANVEETKNEEDVTGEEEESEEEPEEETNEDKTRVNLFKPKDYDFHGKKIKISFDGEYSGKEITKVDNIETYETIYMNIYDSNGKEIITGLEFSLFEPKDEVNQKHYLESLDYFEDTNGKKYLVYYPVATDGGGTVLIDLDNGKKVFSYSHSDIGDYNYNTFKTLEEELGVSFKSYFDKYPQGIMVDHNLIRYFKLEYDEKALYYIEIKIENGEPKVTKEIIKSYESMDDEDFSDLYVPEIDTSIDNVD